MIVQAHAKINLGLNILKKREDGYHDLESILIPLKLHDTISIEKLNDNVKDDFIICDDFSLKNNKTNLCHIILDNLRVKYAIKNRYNISIHKNIFLKSGLGGGSADAAATLQAILQMENINLTKEEKIEFGLPYGCDIPFSIINKPCIIKGKGEIVEPFEVKENCFVILVRPKEGLSTKEVFENIDYSTLISCDIEEVKKALVEMDLEKLGKITTNALEESAIKLLPEIATLKEELKEEGLPVVLMTGSGSTVFALTKNKRLAKKTLEKYSKKGYCVELTEFLLK